MVYGAHQGLWEKQDKLSTVYVTAINWDSAIMHEDEHKQIVF